MPLPDLLQRLHPRLYYGGLLTLVLLTLQRLLQQQKSKRLEIIPSKGERVLVVGASSGIGRSIARQYAERGARVCVVGRRGDTLEKEVRAECLKEKHGSTRDEDILAIAADFARADDMVRVRERIEAEWQGLDTLVVAAGVSALQPLMTVAGASRLPKGSKQPQATEEGISEASRIASQAVQGNYTGPLVTAVTFIPLLSNTSKAPSIVLVNSLASVIPAPTRTIYASTKSASLLLYQALSIEHPEIAFSLILPSTVEGNFRASAVDSGPVREADPNKHGLKREDVATRCIQAADRGEKTVFMPELMRYGHLLYWIWPSFVERRARLKYNFDT